MYAPGKTPEELTPQQNEQVEQGLTNIFEAIDLTKKRAKEKM